MVDYDPYEGNYTGTMIRINSIEANGAVIRIGLGMVPRVWICLPDNSTKDTIYGGTVTGNTLGGNGCNLVLLLMVFGSYGRSSHHDQENEQASCINTETGGLSPDDLQALL